MDNMLGMGVALVIGLGLGFLLARMIASKNSREEVVVPETNWWEIRDSLTGTQMQILQYMEAKKKASITEMHEKFSFIPDRELFYRLEQICLMDFIVRDRREGEICYELNPSYSETVEDDKTVMLSQ